MHVGRIENCTRVLGKCQGYTGLPIRDEVFDLGDERRVYAMRSAWFPSQAEIDRLVAGAPLYLVLLNREHPPVILDVGDTPDGDMLAEGVDHSFAQARIDALRVLLRERDDALVKLTEQLSLSLDRERKLLATLKDPK